MKILDKIAFKVGFGIGILHEIVKQYNQRHSMIDRRIIGKAQGSVLRREPQLDSRGNLELVIERRVDDLTELEIIVENTPQAEIFQIGHDINEHNLQNHYSNDDVTREWTRIIKGVMVYFAISVTAVYAFEHIDDRDSEQNYQ